LGVKGVRWDCGGRVRGSKRVGGLGGVWEIGEVYDSLNGRFKEA